MLDQIVHHLATAAMADPAHQLDLSAVGDLVALPGAVQRLPSLSAAQHRGRHCPFLSVVGYDRAVCPDLDLGAAAGRYD